jgi:quinol monooxygenase YgiN
MSISMPKATCAVCVKFQIKPAFFDDFLAAVKTQAANSKELEPWCHQFDVSTLPDQPHAVLLYETYDDRTAFFEKHRTTSHFGLFSQTIANWVESKDVGVWDIRS